MIKLGQLHAFLINLDLVAAEQIDSWVENPKVIPSGKKLSADGIVLFRQEYDAVFSIERYPHKKHDVNVLFGQLCAWLMENDGDRDDIPEPITDVDIHDNNTADIEINISFEEDVQAIEDVNGPISLNGKTYSLGDAVVDIADEGEVTT